MAIATVVAIAESPVVQQLITEYGPELISLFHRAVRSHEGIAATDPANQDASPDQLTQAAVAAVRAQFPAAMAAAGAVLGHPVPEVAVGLPAGSAAAPTSIPGTAQAPANVGDGPHNSTP